MSKIIHIASLLAFFMILLCGCSNKIESAQQVQTINEGVVRKENKTMKFVVDDKLIDSNDVMKIIEPLWWGVSIYDSEEKYKKDLEKFSDSQKYVFAIEWYITEVNNGGHTQFYYNSTGIVWEDAMKGFEIVGLLENNKIIGESAKRLGGYPNKDREKRFFELEKVKPSFDDLDDRFYEIDKDMDIILMKYIKENKKDFYFEGSISKPIEE